ncbi:polyprenyl synthetase family protein [Pseudomonas sp. R1-6]|uniref:polyprenyl synthetase family protein n=1 Tax=Pseudomonas sp. R1-6 TaxID=2817397 RepID=UPI003DA908DD
MNHQKADHPSQLPLKQRSRPMTIEPDATVEYGFSERLEDVRAAIEQRLDQLLPSSSDERDLVALAMRDSTLAPGKRIRPILLILAAQGLGHGGDQALELGCAVELIHAASLVLDDMPCMDNARLRRGQPTVHLKFGEDVAILAAVALLSRAFGVAAGITDLAPAIRMQLVEVMANTVGMQGLVKGQFKDLRDGQKNRPPEEIALTNNLKTGVLFSAIMDMAWLISGAKAHTRPILQDFAVELGQAFQMYDDLLDRCPDSNKDQGKDEGKSTFVALYGEQKVREQLEAHLMSAESHLREVFGPSRMITWYVRMIFEKAVRQRGARL